MRTDAVYAVIITSVVSSHIIVIKELNYMY